MRHLTTILLTAATAFTFTGIAHAQSGGGGAGGSSGPAAGPGAGAGGGAGGGGGHGRRHRGPGAHGGGSGGGSGSGAQPQPRRGHHGGQGGGARRPGGGHSGGGNPIFQRLDTDGDGQISAAEARAAGAPRAAQIMAADANGDGFVTPDELRAYRQAQAFARLDKNNDGKLDARELRRARRLRGADADGDGFVTLQEYLDFLAAQAAQATARRQTAQAFQAADANNDHKLDRSEWPPNASASFSDVDANGDGQVTGREVGAYMQAHNGASPF